jgi:hypothetical protein
MGDLLLTSAQRANPPLSPFFKGGRKPSSLDGGAVQLQIAVWQPPLQKGAIARSAMGDLLLTSAQSKSPSIPLFQMGKKTILVRRRCCAVADRRLAAPFAKGGDRAQRDGGFAFDFCAEQIPLCPPFSKRGGKPVLVDMVARNYTPPHC